MFMEKLSCGLLSFLLLTLCISAEETKAGFSVIDITPDVSSKRKSKKITISRPRRKPISARDVQDEIFVRTVAIRDTKGKTLVIVTADTYKIPPLGSCVPLQQWFYERYDKKQFALITNSSITYSAPDLNHTVNPDFAEHFQQACKDGIESAIADLSPVSIKYAVLKTKEDIMTCNRNVAGLKAISRSIVSVNELPILLFYLPTNKLKAVLYSCTCRANLVADKVITADYPGAISRSLKKCFSHDLITLFAQGAAGNVYFLHSVMDKMGRSIKEVKEIIGRYDLYRISPKQLRELGQRYSKCIVNGIRKKQFVNLNIDLKMVIQRYDIPLKDGRKYLLYLGRYQLSDNLQIVAVSGAARRQLGTMVKEYYRKKGIETIFLGYSYHGGTLVPDNVASRKFPASDNAWDQYVMKKIKELKPQ